MAAQPAHPLVQVAALPRRRSSLVWTLSPVMLVVTDGVAVLVGFFLAYWLRFGLGIPPPAQMHALDTYIGFVVVATTTILVAIAASGLYQAHNLLSVVEQCFRLVIAVAMGLVVTVVIGVFTWRNAAESSRLLMAYFGVLSLGLAGLGRYAWVVWRDALGRRGVLTQTCLVVGTGPTAERVVQHLAQVPALGYRVVGCIAGKSPAAEAPAAPLPPAWPPILGRFGDLEAVLRRVRPDELIVADPALTHQDMLSIIDRAMATRARIRVFPDLFQIMMSEASLINLHGLPLIGVKSVELQAWQRTVKRWFDVVFAAAALVVLSPLLLLLALLVKLDSRGPAFYVQERVGMDGTRFHIIKFRSMIHEAETRTGKYWTVPDDPRRTRLGQVLRRFSLDELPNLINVLVGDMSIVGPRAERPMFVDQFKSRVPDYTKRLREKSGMTGWAQVNGLRGDVSIEERTKFDLYYVENWSLWLDLKIILRSIFKVFRDPSAY